VAADSLDNDVSSWGLRMGGDLKTGNSCMCFWCFAVMSKEVFTHTVYGGRKLYEYEVGTELFNSILRPCIRKLRRGLSGHSANLANL
jgi:hypothetical protein